MFRILAAMKIHYNQCTVIYVQWHNITGRIHRLDGDLVYHQTIIILRGYINHFGMILCVQRQWYIVCQLYIQVIILTVVDQQCYWQQVQRVQWPYQDGIVNEYFLHVPYHQINRNVFKVKKKINFKIDKTKCNVNQK